MEKNIIVFKRTEPTTPDGKKTLNIKERQFLIKLKGLLKELPAGSQTLSTIKPEFDKIWPSVNTQSYQEYCQKEYDRLAEKLKSMYGKFYHVTIKNSYPYETEFLFMPYMYVKGNYGIGGIKINTCHTEYVSKVEDVVLTEIIQNVIIDDIEYVFEEITEEEFRKTAQENAVKCLDARLKKMYERDTLTENGYVTCTTNWTAKNVD